MLLHRFDISFILCCVVAAKPFLTEITMLVTLEECFSLNPSRNIDIKYNNINQFSSLRESLLLNLAAGCRFLVQTAAAKKRANFQ